MSRNCMNMFQLQFCKQLEEKRTDTLTRQVPFKSLIKDNLPFTIENKLWNLKKLNSNYFFLSPNLYFIQFCNSLFIVRLQKIYDTSCWSIL